MSDSDIVKFEHVKKFLKNHPSEASHQAELDVFKSGFTYDESADYSLQGAQQSAIRALCLVTHDISPGLIRYRRQQSVYYSYDRYLIGDVNIHW
jgi:hypothetical protein